MRHKHKQAQSNIRTIAQIKIVKPSEKVETQTTKPEVFKPRRILSELHERQTADLQRFLNQ